MNQGVIQNAMFTVYLQERGPYENVHGGYITYGDVDRTHCGPVIGYYPLTSDAYFQFKIDGARFGVRLSCATPCIYLLECS